MLGRDAIQDGVADGEHFETSFVPEGQRHTDKGAVGSDGELVIVTESGTRYALGTPKQDATDTEAAEVDDKKELKDRDKEEEEENDDDDAEEDDDDDADDDGGDGDDDGGGGGACAADCQGYTCDQLNDYDYSQYACATLEASYGCDCTGCTGDPNCVYPPLSSPSVPPPPASPA